MLTPQRLTSWGIKHLSLHISPLKLLFSTVCITSVSLLLFMFIPSSLNLVVYCQIMHGSVTMQAQKEAPADMQCKDKFLLQSAVSSPGTTTKDITQEMVTKSFV